MIPGTTPVLVHNCGDALKHSESHLADSFDDNTYFHYIDEAGHDAIMNGRVVNANSKGVSYFTQDMVSSGDANNVLFAGNPAYAGRGSHVIAFRMPEGVLQPGVQPNEMVHTGSFRFSPGRRDLPRTQPIWLVRSMLIIENYDDLLALNRALMEVRYLARDVDSATRGSAFLSSMHSRVIDELVGYHESRGESRKVETWHEWRRLTARNIEKASIATYLVSVWPHLKTVEQKREVVVNQARPFTFSDDEISALIEQIDSGPEKGAEDA